MPAPEIVRRAFEVFTPDLEAPPPLTLRGGNAVDGYDRPEPFDPARDQPTDAYLEGFTFWGLGYLDARSWRHYLPRLIDYTLRRPDNPAMVVDALVQSLRPPDRYPPRLASLSPEQEAVVIAFLEQVAVGDVASGVRDEAQQALEEWWLPNPRSRPTSEEIEAARQAPVRYRLHDGGLYRLEIPETLHGSGARDIPEESRRVEAWGGLLRGDAHTVIAVNVSPIEARSLADAVQARSVLYRDAPTERAVDVRGARQAHRLEGLTCGDSPAEPQVLTLLVADTGRSLVTLSIRAWPRDDVARDVERIASSFELTTL
ncbi:MAG: hypothetical protein JJE40_06295 [Vicinamibacteria bacterium]|nr:hypothetical protein [Vicinamibacteria bacterium]